MKNPLEPFEQLAQHARQETGPAVDVASRVIRTLRSQVQPLRREDRGWLAFAALSLVVACVATIYGLSELDAMVDPLYTFLQPFSSVLP